MGKSLLRSLVLGPVATNCYVLQNVQTKELIVIDPAADSERILRMIDQLEGTLTAILLTHGHFDHIGAVEALRCSGKVPVYACHREQQMLENSQINMTAYYGEPLSLHADHYLEDLDVFEAAGFQIQMIHTPGHTKGSCCYYIEEEGILFSGDTLFCESVGRTDFPGGSSAEIRESLHRLLNSLPEGTEVFPGHSQSSTIGHEKRYNPFV